MNNTNEDLKVKLGGVAHFAVVDAVGAEEGTRNGVIARESGESDMEAI